MDKTRSKIADLNVLLGVTGGIAAYKAVDLASKLTAEGTTVRTVMSESALQFVGAKSFEAVTNSSVFTSLFSRTEEHRNTHINLADWVHIVVVAPATANIIGKLANGICDDILSTVLCSCWTKPILLAPAMNNRMWTNPAVQHNFKIIKDRGIHITGPETGRLACGAEGAGRMSEPKQIIEAIKEIASRLKR